MNEAQKEAVAVWKRLNAIPDLQAASLSKSGGIVHIESSWNVTDPAKHDDSAFSKSWIFDPATLSVTQLPSRTSSTPKTLVKKSLPTSAGFFCQIVEIEVGKSKEYFVEKWDQDKRLHRIPLAKTIESVPKDTEISGSLVMSDDGKFCVFAAELKEKTKKSFFDEVPEKTDDKKADDTTYGEKHLAKLSWGEQMTKTNSPGIVLVNFDDESVKKVHKALFSFGDPQINSSGDILYTVLPESPYKLGRIYCTNRSMTIAYTTLADFEDLEKHSQISDGCRSARFVPGARNFVYLKRPPMGPHMDCDSIGYFDLETEKAKELVGVVDQYPEEDYSFSGIYCSALGKRPFVVINDRPVLLVSSVAKNRVGVFVISLETGELERIKQSGSCSLLATSGSMALISNSAHNSTPVIQLLTFNSPESFESHQISSPAATFDCNLENFELKSKAGCPFQTHLLSKPGNSSLMLRPHGGPNSCITAGCIKTYLGFVDLGYDVLLPNYVGSIGYGKEALYALGGKIGDYDVADCLTALDEVLKSKTYESVFVCGGSHGGFLTAHLSAARPYQFAAAAIANGVINLNTMRAVTDIPDWCDYQTFGYTEKFVHGSVATDAQLARMRAASPISKVDKVACPTLVAIGWEDLRVPPPQGVEWVRALQKNGVECAQLDYPEDCHPISNTESYADEFVHTHAWFQKHKLSSKIE